MKNNIIINFENIISELESKDLKLCFLRDRGLFIEDSNKNLYRIESDYIGSYLDNLIKYGIVIEFNRVNSSYIEDWEKEIWDVQEVKNFIKRQRLVVN